MKQIHEIDPNFKVETNINKPDIRFYNTLAEPFALHGVFYEGDRFRRMPEEVAREVNEGVLALHANTAGGRVRFVTDSPYIAIHCSMDKVGKMPHFAFCGSAGFDLYLREAGQYRYLGTFRPPMTVEAGFEGVVEVGGGTLREYVINFPLYSDVTSLHIGLADGAALQAPTAYRIEKPVVYYGSSITQGGCASRPGNAYQGMVTHMLDCDHINLGFSGNARGEDAMAHYIAALPMSAFVYDYDHNAPTVEHLRATHARMFGIIRAAQPTLPIVLLSRPQAYLTAEEEERMAVVRETYEAARAAGDENVYYIPGPQLMALAGTDGTVDNAHPNDLGFASMARALAPVLQQVLA